MDAFGHKADKSKVNIGDMLSANGVEFYFDYQNGEYGFNTDPERGANTFVPFKSGFKETVIWTNPSPTSAMSSGTNINIDSGYSFSNYDFIKIKYKLTAGSTTTDRESSLMLSYTELTRCLGTSNTMAIALGGVGSYRMSRLLYYRSDTQLYNYACTDTNGNLQNSGCIPTKIIGINLA